MDLMRERMSDTYRVQDEMMMGQDASQFNQAPPQYNTMSQQYNNAQPQYNPVQYNQVPQYNTPRGDRVGYRGGGRGIGGFGCGRGPVVCHNCQQPGHYARECPLPPATCMYCRATDHDTEDCTTLLGKIQEKQNQKNQNV
jgi:hypothetical protein